VDERQIEIEKMHREDMLREKREYNRKARLAVMAALGGKCVKCGFSDARALQIDHVNNDGSSERNKANTAVYYKKVIESFFKGEKKYQLMCCNCNWIKRFEPGGDLESVSNAYIREKTR
jgi:hypothetical protein